LSENEVEVALPGSRMDERGSNSDLCRSLSTPLVQVMWYLPGSTTVPLGSTVDPRGRMSESYKSETGFSGFGSMWGVS